MKLCECGCGQPAPISPYSLRSEGRVKGQPIRFIKDHQNRRPLIERFVEKIDLRGAPSTCWIWDGYRSSSGYGRIKGNDPKVEIASRVAYELLVGLIPDNLCVCHSCDNPQCCNPAHLFLGTHADNVADSMSKNRHVRGERQGGSKLTAVEVMEIRSSLAEGKQLAEHYGVSQGTISMIRSRKRWAHLP